MYRVLFKRLFDVAISVCGLVLLFIPMAVIAVMIKADSRGGAIFRQRRLGKDKKLFTLYKFRTMVPDAYEHGGTNTYEGDPRITKTGALLRKTSLDELPQLWNILKGEMSVIGPRPILPEEESEADSPELYSERYTVRPGMFCTVDISYRSAASRTLQFEMDRDYVRRLSLPLDVKILLGVIKTVVTGSNVYKDKKEEVMK